MATLQRFSEKTGLPPVPGATGRFGSRVLNRITGKPSREAQKRSCENRKGPMPKTGRGLEKKKKKTGRGDQAWEEERIAERRSPTQSRRRSVSAKEEAQQKQETIMNWILKALLKNSPVLIRIADRNTSKEVIDDGARLQDSRHPHQRFHPVGRSSSEPRQTLPVSRRYLAPNRASWSISTR